MSEAFVSVISTPALIDAIKKTDFPPDIEAGNPASLGSLSDALDSPFGSEEVRQVLQLLELALKDGTAALLFVNALIDLLRKTDTPAAELKDSKTGSRIAVVKIASNPKTVAKQLTDFFWK
jgi:hypothetical protein